MSPSELAAVEPHCAGVRAIYSPHTGIVDWGLVAQHYAEAYGVDVAPSRILLTLGASAALVATFAALFAAGDGIAVARPGYPAYRNTISALGRRCIEVDCGPEVGFRLTPSALERLAERPRGVVVASPANPSGAVLSRDELAALGLVAKAGAKWTLTAAGKKQLSVQSSRRNVGGFRV